MDDVSLLSTLLTLLLCPLRWFWTWKVLITVGHTRPHPLLRAPPCPASQASAGRWSQAGLLPRGCGILLYTNCELLEPVLGSEIVHLKQEMVIVWKGPIMILVSLFSFGINFGLEGTIPSDLKLVDTAFSLRVHGTNLPILWILTGFSCLAE